MANEKVTALPELTTPASDDLLYIVDDVAGTPSSKKISRANLLSGVGDVVGPASSVDNQIVRFDSTTGKIIQGVTNGPTIDDNGDLTMKSSKFIHAPIIRSDSTQQFQDQFGSGATLFINHSARRLGAGFAVVPQGTLHSRSVTTGGSFMQQGFTGIVGTPQTVLANGTGDVTLVLSGTFTVSDGAGNVAGGVITATAPSGTFNLYDDGGTNTLQLQVAADGSVVVVRTAGARTYAVNLCLNWL